MHLVGRLKTCIASLMAVILFLYPVMIQAQDAQQARIAGMEAAEGDTNGTLWFGAGCLVGIIGVGAAYLYEPNPPAADLVGKSQDYVASYTDAYADEAQTIQQKNAWYGLAANCVFWVVYYVAAYDATIGY
ncbi:MAG: hypothetical protein GF372_02970 [Candidatus Marinimicrobia bacterium]|nr:hypothetical protein [Candidatus Neomarinimicrobiota bacterium]